MPTKAGIASQLGQHATRYLLGVFGLAVVGAVGYGWGYRNGLVERPTTAAQPPSVAPSTARAIASPAPLAQDSTDAPALAIVAAPTEHRRGSASSGTSAAARPSANPPGLDEEVRQLRRIDAALRDGNPRLAAVLGEELDRVLPSGQLLEERHAAELMANCQLHADNAAERAVRFIEGHPQSPYVARLREVCQLSETQRNVRAPGTDVPRKAGQP